MRVASGIAHDLRARSSAGRRGRVLVAVLALVSAGVAAPPAVQAAPALPLSQSGVSVATSGGSIIAAGGHHTCAIKTDGTLACWGDNTYGQATPPSGTYTAVSAGYFHTCAIKTDGTLACWGYNTSGQATPPSGTYTAVSAGGYHTCAIKTDGTLACWGYNDYGQATPPSGTYTAVSAGGLHTCAIKTAGTLACWGRNADGQAPPTPPSGAYTAVSAGGYHTCAIKTTDGTPACWGSNTYGEAPPTPPPGTYTAVIAGGNHTCAIKTDGTLACWGYNNSGQAPPTPPSGTYTAVSAGWLHTCAIKTDGTLACWGDNTYGQLDGMPSGTFGGARLPAVSAGRYHTCAIKTDGTLACWGYNTYGQATPPPGTYTAVGAGGYHTCAIKTNGTLACWGYNSSGQAPPTPPSGTYTAVSAGSLHTCAIKTDGTLACWGYNYYGQAPPTPPSGTYTAVGAGGSHTCAIKTDGTLACWGYNDDGEATPPSGTYTAMGAGGAHTCAIKTDGTMACWGLNDSGQATPPSGTYTAVSAGDSHTCAIKTNGTLACWGDNAYGQATAPSGTYTAVGAGRDHTCAVKTDGTLACWGSNTYGQSTLPAVTLSVSGFPSPTTAGAAHNVTVTAVDAFGGTATGYTGTVHFSSSDGAAILPANTTLTSGTGTFSVALKTVGTQSVTATDTVTASITGSQSGIAVQAGSLDHLVLSPANATITAGGSQGYTATGYDHSNNSLGDVTSATTFAISGSGSCTAASCTSVVPGDHTVTGTDGSATGTATLHVVAPAGATYHAITPTRVLDTRNGTGGLAGPFTNHAARTFTVSGVPAGAIAVTGNLTVTGQTSSGYLFIGPVATNNPGSSTLNFPVGDDRANAVTVALSGTGTLSITFVAPSNGPTAHAIFDVTGYFTPDVTGATYHALSPTRALDTRNGTGGLSGPFSNHIARTFTVSGVPAGAIAVTGNLTVTGQTSSGYLFIGPVATNNPGSSTLNFPVGDDRANAVTVALGAGGTLSITFVAPSSGPTAQAIFDVTGYFTADMSGAVYVPLTPNRVLDTRNGTGGLAGPFTNHAARTFTVAGVPSGAIAVTGNLTVTGQTSNGYLFIGPVATNNPSSSTLNFPVGDDRANAVTVALGTGTLSITFVAPSNGPTAHAIFDVTGYYQ